MPILYLAGARRSGSTLLSRMLNEMDGIGAVGEMYFFANADVCGCDSMPADCPVWSPIYRAAEEHGGREAFRAGVQRLHMRNVLGALTPSRRAAMFGDLEDFGELLRRIYMSARDSLGVRLIVDESKHPLFGAFVASQPWAEVRFLRLLRDPVAVARSYANAKSHYKMPSRTVAQRSPLWSAAHYLVQNAGAGWAARATERPFLSIKFENLASDPAGVVRTVADFADIDTASTIDDRTFVANVNHILASNPDKHERGRVVVRESMHDPCEGMPSSWRLIARSTSWPARRMFTY